LAIGPKFRHSKSGSTLSSDILVAAEDSDQILSGCKTDLNRLMADSRLRHDVLAEVVIVIQENQRRWRIGRLLWVMVFFRTQ